MVAAVWGPRLAPVLARMLAGRPALAHRLALAPPRVVHAVAAGLWRGIEDDLPPDGLAQLISERDVRDVLSFAIPQPHPRLLATLDRAGSTVLPLSFYVRLNGLLHGPAADLLAEADPITRSLLDTVEAIVLDPVLLAARKCFDGASSDRHLLQSVLAFLRATGLANRIETLPSGSGWRAILRRVKADLAPAVCPPVPFAAPENWQIVGTLGDLFEIGRRLGNCVGSLAGSGHHHLRQFSTGDAVFLTARREQEILAMVLRVAPTQWTLEQIAGKERLPLTLQRRDLVAKLHAVMTQASHTLLDDEPFNAMHIVAWRARRDPLRDAEDGALDDAA